MKVAVLSGKGGAGKTFISVNLSCAAKQSVYVDCDVEEPNGHLFLKPEAIAKTPVMVLVPKVDMSKCTRCRKCVAFCKYNALALVKDEMLVFHEICHSCGGCAYLCPAKAIMEEKRIIGSIEEGSSGNVRVLSGSLNIGEVSGVPIIKSLLKKLPENGDIIIDCPPGSGCTVMESIRDADFCVLVAEPTLFGAHNLSMVHELVKLFKKPFGVVLNKCVPEENPSERFCAENQISILARIPYDRKIGGLGAKGCIAAREEKQHMELFENLLASIKREAAQ